MRTSIRRALVPLTLLLLLVCGSWGFLGHRTIHQLAVYELPRGMRPFFYRHIDSLVYHSVRPDVRRNSDPDEATRHFIDLEAFGDSAAWKMPLDWETAVARYTPDSLLKYGHAPYWIINLKGRLTEAFRARNADSILFYAADLGHYVSDIHVPLHTSLNYDGQLTGQKGLHSLWESAVPEQALSSYRLHDGHKARYLDKPEEAVWGAIRQAHSLLPQVFGLEKELSRSFPDSVKYRVQVRNGRESRSYSTAFARAYGQQLGTTVNDQLLRSAALMADLWYTSWVDAGCPDLEDLAADAYTKAEKKALKRERKAWKNGELIEKGLLRSRRPDNR